MVLKCCDGNPADAKQTMSILRSRPTVLVDLSAIATARLLGLEWFVGTARYCFTATEGTWEELQETFRELDFRDDARFEEAFAELVRVLRREDPTWKRQSASDRSRAETALRSCAGCNYVVGRSRPRPGAARVQSHARCRTAADSVFRGNTAAQ
jgi:hypothetical protein